MQPTAMCNAPKSRTVRRFIFLGSPALVLLILVPVFLVTHSQHLVPQIPSHKSPFSTPTTRCILYDRPHRAASTTLSEALTACLATRNYSRTPQPYDTVPEHLIIRNLVTQPSARRSATSKHLAISAHDVLDIHAHCPQLLYVTSTRPMVHRIASYAKYAQIDGHGHANLSVEQMRAAAKLAKEDIYKEKQLEHYPFTSDIRLLPHYIVRHHRFREDLAALLAALRCPQAFVTKNTHLPEDEHAALLEEQIRQNVTLRYGDARHTLLTALAQERNWKGIELARLF